MHPRISVAIVTGLVAALAIACWQAIALIGMRIVALARNHAFDSSAYGWLRGIVGCLLAFAVLVVIAFSTLNAAGFGTPGAMLGLVGMGLTALIGASSLALFLGTRPFRGHYAYARVRT